MRDYAEVRADGAVTRQVARDALAVYDVDELGLDRLDRAVLGALVRSFGGGPVGVSTLAVAVGEEPGTVEEVCEPYLVRAGMLARTPRGRVATAAAWAIWDRPAPPDVPRWPLPRCSERGAGRLDGLRRAEMRRSWITSLLFPCSSCCCSSRSSCPVAAAAQMQEMQTLQAALEPGDVVMTTSGLRGTVVDASYEETVDLEIADGVVTTWVRAAVQREADRARRGVAGRRRSRPSSRAAGHDGDA